MTATQAPTQAPTQSTATAAPTETPHAGARGQTPTPTRRRRRPRSTPRPPRRPPRARPRRPRRPRRRSRTEEARAPGEPVGRSPGQARVCIEKDTGKASTSTSTRGCAKVETPRAEAEAKADARSMCRSSQTPNGSPAATNPSYSLATPGPGQDRRAELLHRQVPDPAVPAPDLPGRRHAVRHPLGGPGRRSTRSRPTTAATSTSPPPAPLGWMQFMPATWKQYGVDANRDGVKDPFNPVDAIFAAARYLQGRGRRHGPAPGDLRLQPRRLVRRLRADARPASSAACRPTSSAR